MDESCRRKRPTLSTCASGGSTGRSTGPSPPRRSAALATRWQYVSGKHGDEASSMPQSCQSWIRRSRALAIVLVWSLSGLPRDPRRRSSVHCRQLAKGVRRHQLLQGRPGECSLRSDHQSSAALPPASGVRPAHRLQRSISDPHCPEIVSAMACSLIPSRALGLACTL